MNRTLAHALFALVCLLLLAAGAVFGEARQARRVCTGVQVRIANESDNFFLTEQDVRGLLTGQGAIPVTGQRITSLNLGSLERRLRTNPFVREAEVSRDLTGFVRVRVRQNRPVARLIHPDASLDQYVAEDGHLLPLSPRYTARVLPVAFAGAVPFAPGADRPGTGTKPTAATAAAVAKPQGFFRDSTGLPYLGLVRRVNADPFWRAQVAQVSILPDGKVVLWPQVGDHLIQFGYPDRVNEKFQKLLAFYRHVLPALGWDRFRRVNVEYRNQIVCQ